MASDQLHHQLQTQRQAMFADHEHHDDSPHLNNFDALFSTADPTFEPTWNLDANPPPSASSVPQSWQSSAATARPHSLPAGGSTYADQFYSRAFSGSPASFQHVQHAYSHNSNIHSFAEPALDPALAATPATNQSNFNIAVPNYPASISRANTIAPATLQAAQQQANAAPQTSSPAPLNNNHVAATAYNQPAITQPTAPLVRPNFPTPPKPAQSGKFWLINFEELCNVTNSSKLESFLAIGNVAVDIATNRTTIPTYQKRRSRNEIRALAAGDEKLLEKIARKPKKVKKVEIKIKKAAKASTDLKQETTSSSSDYDTSDSDYDSSDDEPPEVSPLPKARPDRPLEAIKYDTIKAVWLPRRTPAQANRIRNSLTEFYEVVRTIRDRWKVDANAVKEAESDEKKKKEVPLLKDRVRAQREMLEIALRTAIEHGHPEVLRVLGGHYAFLLIMYQFLAERIGERDYTSSLGSSIIELLSQATTLSTEAIEKAKLAKVFTLFSKRGDEQIQARIKQILENADKVSKAQGSPPAAQKPSDDNETEKEAKAKGAVNKDAITKSDPPKRASAEPVAGVKRPRPTELNASLPVKRIASGSVPANKPPGDPKPVAAAPKRPLAGNAEKPATAAPVAKQKVVVKAPSFFPGLQSASKKPGTTTATIAKKKVIPAASSKPAFSFSATMANLLNKQPEPTAKQEEKLPPETEEERAKRLRKEERRKLRVRFKEGALLENIRYFTHDPEEEMGHDASMVRDAGDVHGEGRMFKQHKDMMDLDEDEEQSSEESFREWVLPSSIDFSSVDIEERKRNYEPFGGGFLKPQCPEKETQEDREKTVLMVFYSHSSDIPPSPKEPVEEEVPPSKPPVSFGTPTEPTQSRAAAFAPPQSTTPTPQPQPQNPPASGAPDLSSLLNMLTAAAPPVTAPPKQNDLGALLASLSSLNPQAQQPQPSQPVAVQPPWNFMQPTPAVPNPVGISNQIGMPNAGSVSNPLGLPDADQLILQLKRQQQFAPSQAQGFNFANAQTSQQQNPGPYEDPERKRLRDGGHEPEKGSHHDSKRHKGKGGHKNPNPPKFVVPCRFFKEGKCKKGDECTYLHT